MKKERKLPLYSTTSTSTSQVNTSELTIMGLNPAIFASKESAILALAMYVPPKLTQLPERVVPMVLRAPAPNLFCSNFPLRPILFVGVH